MKTNKKVRMLIMVAIFSLIAVIPFFSSDQTVALAVEDDADYDLSGKNDLIPTNEEYDRLGIESEEVGATGFNCDEFYDFGSIGSEIKPEKDNYKAGEEVTFRGTISNKNKYPIVNGGLYVRILRNNEAGLVPNGDNIIDEFFVAEDISLAPAEEREMEFKWNIPSQSIKGEYTVATFFVIDKKFNLSGLSFWNHTYAGFSNFSVEGNNGGFYFDRNKVNVNNESFDLRSTYEPFGKDEPIEVKVPLVNGSAQGVEAKLKYKLYYWDSLQDNNLIEEKEESVYLKANSSKEVVYSIGKLGKSAYYLNLTAEVNGQKSVVNVRLMTDAGGARINFSGIDNFPVSSGDNLTSFVCFHNTSFSGEIDGKIEQVLKDRSGNVIDKLEYDGNLGKGNIGAIKNNISAKQDYDYIAVETNLYSTDGKIIETAKLVYDCKLFDGEYCKNGKADKGVGKLDEGSALSDKGTLYKVIIALSGIMVFVVAVILRKRNKKTLAIFVLLVGLGSNSYLFFDAQIGSSYQVTDPTAGADMFPFRSRIWTSVVYDINLRQSGVNLVTGQTLPNGNSINFAFAKNGEWAREGGGMDTPAVSWDTWSGAGCSNYYFSNGSCQNQGWWGFVRCNTPATRQVTAVSGPVTCDGSTCAVTGYTTPSNPIIVRTSISRTNCATRIYARGTGTNSGSCAWDCFNWTGGNTSICSENFSGLPCTAANYTACRCNDRAAGNSNCPEQNVCRLFEERAYNNFVPADSRDWVFFYPAPPSPSISISATPNPVSCDQSATTVTWSNSGGNPTQCWAQCYNANTSVAMSCPGFDNSAGTAPFAGTYNYSSAMTGGIRFDVTCANGGGTSEARVTVTKNACVVVPAPTLSFNATSPISSGESSTLTWNTTNTASCTASGGWSGPKSEANTITRTETTAPLVSDTTFTLECLNNDTPPVSTGPVSKTVTVNPPPPACSPNPNKTYSCAPAVCSSTDNCTDKPNRCLVDDGCPPLEYDSPSVCRDNGTACEDSSSCPCPSKNWTEVTP